MAYAKRVGSRVSLGIGAKYLKSRLDSANASGYAFDAGALFQLSPSLRLGVAFLNGGPGMAFIGEPFPLPMAGKV
ncbi:MAG: hypothetical protein FD126_3737, partial [Elusimicrobia bacterium]